MTDFDEMERMHLTQAKASQLEYNNLIDENKAMTILLLKCGSFIWDVNHHLIPEGDWRDHDSEKLVDSIELVTGKEIDS